jgi:hypothetical protein
MSNTFIPKRLEFYPYYSGPYNNEELSDEIIIPSYYLNNLINNFNDNETLLVTITNIDNNTHYTVAIGSPHNEDRTIVFIPQWILEILGISDDSDTLIRIEKADTNILPVATNITIRPLDPVAFDIDIINCFERAMMNLHTVREGITIPVFVPEITDDYVIFASIEKVEPHILSRIISSEVNVEFINEFKDIVPLSSTPPLLPTPLPNELSETDTTVEEVPVAPAVQELSNEERRRLVRESWIKRYQNNAKSQ